MARSPAPPGRPPRNYRPPGAPAALPTWNRPLGAAPPAPPPRPGVGAGAVTAVALMTLVLGLVIGFFLGRVTEDGDADAAGPLRSDPSTSTSRPPGDTIPQRPPADPSAPPSTDLAPDTIGSIEDPVPAGQAYILGLYEIEVVGVERDASSTLQDFDPANPSPSQGRQHLIVEVAVRFTDDDGLGNPATIPFFVSDGTARWNDFESTCGAVPDALVGAGLVEKGQEAVGNVCFTVPTEVVGNLRLGTEGFDGPLFFALPD